MTLSAPPAGHALDKLCVNALRFRAVDMVQQADSGYPGLPLGSAAMSYALWDRYLAAEFTRVTDRRLTAGWATDLPVFSERDGPLATRVASGKGIAALSERLPELMGGAADLAPSTHTNMAGAGNYGVSRVAVKA